MTKPQRTDSLMSRLLPSVAQRTDAEWKIHDAEIRAERDRDTEFDLVAKEIEQKRRRKELDGWGMGSVPLEHYDRMIHRRKLVSWGVPVEVVESVEMDSLESWPALIQARAFDAQIKRKPILVLEGTNEEGKSTAAAWWVAQPGPVLPYLDDNKQEIYPPRFLTASSFERLSKFSGADIDRVYWARRLVLDDLGFQGRYPDMVRRLVSLFAHRVAQKLPTVITSNLSRDEWAGIFMGHEQRNVFSRLERAGVWWTAPKAPKASKI